MNELKYNNSSLYRFISSFEFCSEQRRISFSRKNPDKNETKMQKLKSILWPCLYGCIQSFIQNAVFDDESQ